MLTQEEMARSLADDLYPNSPEEAKKELDFFMSQRSFSQVQDSYEQQRVYRQNIVDSGLVWYGGIKAKIKEAKEHQALIEDMSGNELGCVRYGLLSPRRPT